VVTSRFAASVSVLLGDPSDADSVLAAFYALGVRRGAWVVHRAEPGDASEARRALTEAGFATHAHEQSGQLSILETDALGAGDSAQRQWDRYRRLAGEYGKRALWQARSVGQLTLADRVSEASVPTTVVTLELRVDRSAESTSARR
jgi:hypothetical protein